MDDRQLLEAAAKAAGIELEEHHGALFAQRSLVHKREWNPLKDDGDALRLAVKLGMAVSVEYHVGSTVVLWGPPMDNVREPHGTDPSAATRRAIVRAAAAIGAQT